MHVAQTLCCRVILQPLDGAVRQSVVWDLKQRDAQADRRIERLAVRQEEAQTDRYLLINRVKGVFYIFWATFQCVSQCVSQCLCCQLDGWTEVTPHTLVLDKLVDEE